MRTTDVRRIRMRVAVWYVASFALTLLVLSVALFAFIVREISHELDQSLQDTTLETVQVASVAATRGMSAGLAATSASDEVNTEDRPVYVVDSAGRDLGRNHSTPGITRAALIALREGSALSHFRSNGQNWRVYAQAFTMERERFVAVALADDSTVERQYERLVVLFAALGFIAAGLIGLLGYKFSGVTIAPIEASAIATRRFLADAAHELRTPVATLRMRSEVALANLPQDSEQAQALRSIVEESGRIGSIVNDLLALARSDAAEHALVMQRVYLDDIVSDVVASFGPASSAAGVTLALTRYEQAPVVADPDAVRRLITILIDNAVKYTPVSGRVAVSVFADEQGSVMQVEDTGPGIPDAAVPHIFERFYRADATRAAASGSGLGLAIARVIADAHHAVISVASRPGSGSEFQVRFPPPGPA